MDKRLYYFTALFIVGLAAFVTVCVIYLSKPHDAEENETRRNMTDDVNGIVGSEDFAATNTEAESILVGSQTENTETSETAEPEIHYPEDWAFFLINKDNPLPDGYINDIELEAVYNDFKLDSKCAGYAKEMLAAAEKDGIKLAVVSAYRSSEKQAINFDSYVARLMGEGLSKEEAVEATATQIARPGESEHNAGLALDIVSSDWYYYHDDLTEDFDLTPEFEWLAENSWKFGFILRYGKDKTKITGFDYEPWHYRYVGAARAKEIFDSRLSLEEYIGSD